MFPHITSTLKSQWCAEAISVLEFSALLGTFMWYISFICCPLVPAGGVVLWCTRSYFGNDSGHTPLKQGRFSLCFVGLYCSLPAGCQQRSVRRWVGWASMTADKPSSRTGHDGKAHGGESGQTGWRFLPSCCPFNYLPDGGPIQAGISHPIDNVASVSCRSRTHYQGCSSFFLTLPSFRLWLSLILILRGGSALLVVKRKGRIRSSKSRINCWSGMCG